MNYIDMFIVVLLLWAVFRGFTRGFIMQITLLAALTVGVFIALKLSGFTAHQLEGRFRMGSESLYIVSLALTFALVFIAMNLLGKLLEKIVSVAQLSLANRLLGVFFSLCKTILLLGIILVFVDRFDRKIRLLPKNSREHSLFYKPFTTIVGKIFPWLEVPGQDDNSNRQFV